MKRIFVITIFSLGFLATGPVLAHCPLCTAGAGLAAIFASYLGVGAAPIGVFIGAFSVALGWWMSRLIKKRFIPKQNVVLALISFLTIVLPLIPLMHDYSSVYISLGGDYGSLLNRTYLINIFLVGAIIGGLILLVSPYLSRRISVWRKNKMFPYQGLAVTFFLLALAAVILELLL